MQYHPEFKSKPLHPHPLFSAFVAASIAQRDGEDAEDTDAEDEPAERRAASEVEA